MFSHDVKTSAFQVFSHPLNVKFPRQSFAVITVKNVHQICENPFTDISRAGKASGTQDFFREVGEDLFYMTVNCKATTVVGTSHLGGKTSKFDTRNAHVRRHLKTCFVQQHQSECKYVNMTAISNVPEKPRQKRVRKGYS